MLQCPEFRRGHKKGGSTPAFTLVSAYLDGRPFFTPTDMSFHEVIFPGRRRGQGIPPSGRRQHPHGGARHEFSRGHLFPEGGEVRADDGLDD
jgi:hypothetical protein